MHPYRLIPAVAVALTLMLAGCAGGDDEPGTTTQTTGPAGGLTATVLATEANAADIAFAQGMIPHHGQAIEMARLA